MLPLCRAFFLIEAFVLRQTYQVIYEISKKSGQNYWWIVKACLAGGSLSVMMKVSLIIEVFRSNFEEIVLLILYCTFFNGQDYDSQAFERISLLVVA